MAEAKYLSVAALAATLAFHFLAACSGDAPRTTAINDATIRGARPQPPRPEFPKRGQYDRYLGLLDEHGQIPPDALMRAKEQRDALALAPAATGGVSPGTWRWHGPTNVAGRMRALYVHPGNPEILVLGSASGGIWRSEDGGTSWSVVDDWMPSLAVGSIVGHPATPGTLYAGTGEIFASDGIPGAGIFKSEDVGKTWRRLPATARNEFMFVNELAISPKDDRLLLAATNDALYRSADSGESWTAVSTSACTDVHFSPNGSKAIAATSNYGDGTYSTDAGATWKLSKGLPSKSLRVEFAFVDESTVYAGVSVDSLTGYIYKSTDSGANFELTSLTTNPYGTQGYYDNCIFIPPVNDGENILIGGVVLAVSTNRGATWINGGIPHPDIHCIVPHPKYDGASNQTVFVGTDGGLFRVDNTFLSTRKITILNAGLGTAQFYGGAITADDRIIGGMQDNGTAMLRNSTSTNWTGLLGFDGIHSAADPIDPKSYYGTSQLAGVFRILDGGTTPDRFDPPGAGNSATSPFSTFIVLDPGTPQRMYCGTTELMVCDNTKSTEKPTWRAITNHGTDFQFVTRIAVTPGEPDCVYYAYRSRDLIASSNATHSTPTWRNITNGSIQRQIRALVVSPHDPNTVYVGTGGYARGNIVVSRDRGATWRVIDHGSSSPIPSCPVHALAVHPSAPDWIYAGTEVGLFVSTDDGRSWSTSNEGPANVVIDHLVFKGPRLYAFTHGRGVYSAHASSLEDNDAVVRASVSSAELEANGASAGASIDAQGRRVAFHSDATNLVLSDTNAALDIFVRDLQSGTTELVSGAPPGVRANGPSKAPCIAHDGRFVAFESAATNLVVGDTNERADIFVHDLQDNRTERVPPSSGATQPNGASRGASISADGRYVVFTSDASNLVIGDSNQVADVFRHDRARGTTLRMSLVGTTGAANGPSENALRAVSADGNLVTFTSAATNLVTGDTNGAQDVFVRDAANNVTTRVSVDSSGQQAGGDSASATISADGRYVVFDSAATNLVANDSNGHRDVFLHDRQTRTTERVSLTATGGEANGPSFGGVISPDATHVTFFSSAENLVGGDGNKRIDVFVRDLVKRTTVRVSINASNVDANGASALPDIAAHGANIAFQSIADNLVTNDHNQHEDVFTTSPRPSVVVWPASRAILDGFSYATRHFAGPTRSQHVFRAGIGQQLQIDGVNLRRDAKIPAQEAFARSIVLEVDCGSADIDAMTGDFAKTFVKPATGVFSRKPLSLPDLSVVPQYLPGFRVRIPFDRPFIHDGADSLALEFRVFSSDSNDDYPIDMHGEATIVQTKQTVRGTGCKTANGIFTFDATYTSSGPLSELVVDVGAAPPKSPLYLMLGAVDPDVALPGLCARIRTISIINLFVGVADDKGVLKRELPVSPWSPSLMGAQLETQLLTLDLQNQVPLSLSNGLAIAFPMARPGPSTRSVFAAQVGATSGKLEDSAFTIAIDKK